MRVVVIGAGMAGLACAEALADRGCAVTLFDKGRGPGGRMSTRRVETPTGRLSFDHGAQYFTARDPAFLAQVRHWHGEGLVAPWTLAGEDAWVGTPAMNAPLARLAARLGVRFAHHVMGLVRVAGGWQVRLADGTCHGPFDAAVVAVPAEQALAFLGAHDLAMAGRAIAARSQPCWTVLAAFAAPLPVASDVVRDHGALAWAARNGAKPGREGAETWVLQAGGSWSAERIEAEPEQVARLMLAELAALAGGSQLPEPTYLAAHRWRYAMSAGAAATALWNPVLGLGACGDWLLGPRVELAWLSGRALARRMQTRGDSLARGQLVMEGMVPGGGIEPPTP